MERRAAFEEETACSSVQETKHMSTKTFDMGVFLPALLFPRDVSPDDIK